MNIALEIKKFFKGNVLNDSETISKYSRDASLIEIVPKVVVFPKDSSDICNLVKWINERNKLSDSKLSITPRSAGTCMAGGAIGESIIMDFTKYMNEIHEIKKVPKFNILPSYPNAHEVEITGEARVMPGCFYRDFEEATLKQDLLLPCYTASKSINAVGGMVGNNSGGEKTLRYGKTEDYIKELKMVFKDGREYVVKPLTKKELYAKISQVDFEGDVYKEIFALIKENKKQIDIAKPNVSKNSAGYYLWNVWNEEKDVFDLTKLIVGSQGTLGIVTEITFHLVETKPVSKLVVIFMKDLSRLGELVEKIMESKPESLESYDDATLKLAIKFFPDFLKKKGFIGMLKFVFSFLPEAKMILTGGMPKLILLIEFAGVDAGEIDREITDMLKKIQHFGHKTRITKSVEESEKYWGIRRESFALLRKHVKDKHTAPFIDDIIVKPEFLPEFLPKLNDILKNYPITYTIAGHAGNGNFHIIPLMDFSSEETSKIIMELSEKVYELVISYNGSITAEHNDGVIRTPFLKQMFGELVYIFFEKTKQIFDPDNIFNPGKKVGGTKEYIKNHIIKESHEISHRV